MAAEREKKTSSENYYGPNHRRYSYLSRGIYVDQLKEWQKYYPEEQFLIERSEDLFTNAPAVMERVLGFLGLPSFVEREGYEGHNAGSDYSEMSPATEKYLIDYFRPHNERLYEYLGRDLGWKR
jgi:hypothetical protein